MTGFTRSPNSMSTASCLSEVSLKQEKPLNEEDFCVINWLSKVVLKVRVELTRGHPIGF